MATPEFQSRFEKENSESFVEFPLLEGKTSEQLQSIARGIGRTTTTGSRSQSGSPISFEGETIRQLMERNQQQAERERSENG